MPPETLVQRAFASGEIAPGLSARADLKLYTEALRTCRNFVVQRHGGVANRTGSKYVATAKGTGSTEAWLFPFIFAAANESYIVEAGEGYFRFHRNGAPVTVSGVAAWSNATAYVVGDLVVQGGVNYYCILAHTNQTPPNATYWYALSGSIYEIPNPYVGGRFKNPAPLCWSQSGLVVTLTHLEEPPRELVYTSATRWVLRTITTAPSISSPTGLGTSGSTAGTQNRAYTVTAVKATTYEESIGDTAIALTNITDPTPAAPITVTFTPAAGAVEHRVYCDVVGNGIYGYQGRTLAASFKDPGLTPDFYLPPPQARVLFNSTNNYPAVSTVYQQRRIFAGTHTDREECYASQVGKRSNFSIRTPLQDDDAVTWSIASDRIQPVLHLVGLDQLVILTDTGEWVAQGDETGVLRPTSINPRQVGYVGSAFVRPVVIGNAIIFVQARGNVLRDLVYDKRTEGLTSAADLTVLAGHLFRGYTVTDMDYAQVPDSVVWCVRSDGTLLGLTYHREDQIVGWHRHDTSGGLFEQVCVIPEGDEDAVYVVVNRGGTRLVERFASRTFTSLTNCVHLDSAITKSGASSTSVTGLTHLNGATVYALADGVVRGPFTVSGGAITLPAAASVVHVGLRITADVETLDLDVQGSGVRAQRKRVQSIAMLLENSARGFAVGPDTDHLLVDRREPWEASGLVSGQVENNLTAGFTNTGRVVIRHTDPTPLTILGLLPYVDAER